MRFHRPKTIREAFAPMTLFNWLFGMGVVEYPEGRPRRLISVCWSIAHVASCFALMMITDISTLSTVEGSSLAAGSIQLTVYSNLSAQIVCLWVAHAKFEELRSYWKKLTDIDRDLQRLEITNDYEFIFDYQVSEMLFASLCTVLLAIANVFYVGQNFLNPEVRIAFIFLIHYFSLVNAISDWGFVINVRYIGKRFRRLNAFVVRSFRNEDAPLVSRTQRNSEFIEYSNEQRMVRVLRETRKIHRELCNVSRMINDIYSIRLLISTTINVVLVTTLAYSIYVTFDNADPDLYTFDGAMEIICQGSWVVIQSVKMFVIIHACSTTCREITKTGGLIHGSLPPVTRDEVRDEIHIFALQLVQNPVYFTAHGFYSLDFASLGAILGSISTLFVILIQMHGMLEIPDDTSNTTSSSMVVAESIKNANSIV